MTVARFAGAEIGKMLGKGPRFDNIGAQGITDAGRTAVAQTEADNLVDTTQISADAQVEATKLISEAQGKLGAAQSQAQGISGLASGIAGGIGGLGSMFGGGGGAGAAAAGGIKPTVNLSAPGPITSISNPYTSSQTFSSLR